MGSWIKREKNKIENKLFGGYTLFPNFVYIGSRIVRRFPLPTFEGVGWLLGAQYIKVRAFENGKLKIFDF
jgi:hypothetical protein